MELAKVTTKIICEYVPYSCRLLYLDKNIVDKKPKTALKTFDKVKIPLSFASELFPI